MVSGLIFEWVVCFFGSGVFFDDYGVLFGMRIVENLYVLFFNWLLIWNDLIFIVILW